MIKCRAINTCDNITFDSIELLSVDEQKILNLPDLFEDDQLCFKDSFGRIHLANDEMVGLITVGHCHPDNDLYKIQRLTITWDQISFAPCWLVFPELYEKYNVPHVYANLAEQFTFIADDTMYITKDDRVALVSTLAVS